MVTSCWRSDASADSEAVMMADCPPPETVLVKFTLTGQKWSFPYIDWSKMVVPTSPFPSHHVLTIAVTVPVKTV